MSIITFCNRDVKETGQTYTVAAIASQLAINHNYKILMISTDFKDETLERCFFPAKKVQTIVQSNPYLQSRSGLASDVSNGFEGLLRAFQSNRASVDSIKSYTKPILIDRLDILQAPRTKIFEEYQKFSMYYTHILNTANKAYDLVMVDLCNKMPEEEQQKIFDISSLIVMGLTQNLQSIQDFVELKTTNPQYRKNNMILAIEKYNKDSRYTSKNIARFLKEKNIPFAVPYNILFADSCSEGKIIDYLLSIQRLNFADGKDGYFYSELKETAERIDFSRKQFEYQMK